MMELLDEYLLGKNEGKSIGKYGGNDLILGDDRYNLRGAEKICNSIWGFVLEKFFKLIFDSCRFIFWSS